MEAKTCFMSSAQSRKVFNGLSDNFKKDFGKKFNSVLLQREK